MEQKMRRRSYPESGMEGAREQESTGGRDVPELYENGGANSYGVAERETALSGNWMLPKISGYGSPYYAVDELIT
jgi:hypothetical protein